MQQGQPEVGRRDFRYSVVGMEGIGSAALGAVIASPSW